MTDEINVNDHLLEAEAAVRTLRRLGYTWNGGQEWRPPLGTPPDLDADDGWEWAEVEVFGHRRHIGKCREVERFGAKQLRVDELMVASDGEGERWETIYYSGGSIFSYRPITEQLARKAATRFYPPPARITKHIPFEEHEEDHDGASDEE